MNDLDQAVRQFRERMQGLEPGDVLGRLTSLVPPGFRIVVLDRLPDGALILSVPFSSQLRIVPDLLGPFRWSDEDETLVDKNGEPHQLIDLGTLAGARYPSLPTLYQEMVAFVAEHPVVGIDRADTILRAETEMMTRLDFLLSASGVTAAEDDFVRCCQLILGADVATRLSEREQALLIMVMNNILTRCLRNTCVVRVVPTVPGTAPPPDQAAQGR